MWCCMSGTAWKRRSPIAAPFPRRFPQTPPFDGKAYAPSLWQAYRRALLAARLQMVDVMADQESVDAAAQALTDAFAALETVDFAALQELYTCIRASRNRSIPPKAGRPSQRPCSRPPAFWSRDRRIRSSCARRIQSSSGQSVGLFLSPPKPTNVTAVPGTARPQEIAADPAEAPVEDAILVEPAGA